MQATERKAITERIGARVGVRGEPLHGVVVGHYDDDLVYVDFGRGAEGVPTERLYLIEAAPDRRLRSTP